MNRKMMVNLYSKSHSLTLNMSSGHSLFPKVAVYIIMHLKVVATSRFGKQGQVKVRMTHLWGKKPTKIPKV